MEQCISWVHKIRVFCGFGALNTWPKWIGATGNNFVIYRVGCLHYITSGTQRMNGIQEVVLGNLVVQQPIKLYHTQRGWHTFNTAFSLVVSDCMSLLLVMLVYGKRAYLCAQMYLFFQQIVCGCQTKKSVLKKFSFI